MWIVEYHGLVVGRFKRKPEALAFIHRVHPGSYSYALKWGGYRLIRRRRRVSGCFNINVSPESMLVDVERGSA